MTPRLWPDLAHLPALLAIGVIAVLCIGLGSLGSLGGARRAETALIAGWGMASLASLIAGTLTALPLTAVMIALGGLGAGGCTQIVWRAARHRSVMDGAGFGRIVLLALPLLVLIESIEPANWDDFSHWLPNARYLAAQGHFPTLAWPVFGSAHAAYPDGMALPGYGAALLTGQWSDSAGITWSAVLLLAACSTIAGLLEERLTAAGQKLTRPVLWGCAGLAALSGIMLCPSFTPKFALSNTADGATAAVLAILCKNLLDVMTAEPRDAADGRLITLGWTSIALVNLRQTNLVMLALTLGGFAVVTLLWRRRLVMADLIRLAVPALAGLTAWALWNAYAAAQIPGGQFAFLPVAAWRWGMVGAILGAVLRTMAIKGGFFALAALAGAYALRRGLDRDPSVRRAAVLPAATAIVIAGNAAFLTFTYFAAQFSDDEARQAASFWRYSEQAGLVLMLALAQIVPLRILAPLRSGLASGLACLTAALAPLIMPGFVRYDLRSDAAALETEAEDIARIWRWRGPIQLVDFTGNGFEPMVVADRLHATAPHDARAALPVTITASPYGLPWSPAELAPALSAKLVWLAEGSSAADGLTAAPLSGGCSYLLAKRQDRFVIVGSWPRAAAPTSLAPPCGAPG